MLLALVLCFDHRKGKGDFDVEIAFSKGYKYIWYAAVGYGIGLIAALAAGVLTRAPQPALLYLVRLSYFHPKCRHEFIWDRSILCCWEN